MSVVDVGAATPVIGAYQPQQQHEIPKAETLQTRIPTQTSAFKTGPNISTSSLLGESKFISIHPTLIRGVSVPQDEQHVDNNMLSPLKTFTTTSAATSPLPTQPLDRPSQTSLPTGRRSCTTYPLPGQIMVGASAKLESSLYPTVSGAMLNQASIPAATATVKTLSGPSLPSTSLLLGLRGKPQALSNAATTSLGVAYTVFGTDGRRKDHGAYKMVGTDGITLHQHSALGEF